MQTAYLAVGSNLPPPGGTIRDTLARMLEELPREGLELRLSSPWFSSPAFPIGNGPDYVNGALVVDTPLTPPETLAALQRIEVRLGRVRALRWAPRIIDLDLLAQGDAILPGRARVVSEMALGPLAGSRPAPERLILPHPRLHQRGFVLVPLARVAPDWHHPILLKTVMEMLHDLPEPALEGVVRVDA